MKYSTVISLLICALLAFSTAQAQEQSDSNTIKLGLFEGSNEHWIAIAVQDEDVDTTAVQMRDSSEGASWTDMTLVEGWEYWVVDSSDAYVFPLSFRITSKAEQEIVIENIIADLDADLVDTGIQFSAPRISERRKGSRPVTPTSRPTKAPTTRPTKAPTTVKPTTRPTKASTTSPTKAPTTVTPTTRPTKTPTVSTKAPTVSTTRAPVQPVTVKPTIPSNANSGSNTMKMMVPLYTYPGATWDTIAASGRTIPTVAIINPNSGPGNGPDSTYKTYMNKLKAANVEMIGYVHSSWGARPIADVKADIDKYASEFPLVVGIFIDEAAATADQVSYYTQVHNYIMSMPGYKYNVLNPGTAPTQAYMSISTQIVTFENTASKFASSSNPSYANAANKDHFAVISYGASSSQMQSAMTAAKSKGYYGWVYVTDGSGASTYNTIPSYYNAMASYVAAL